MRQLEAGDHLDQYLLVDVLARTAMATTFKAHDTEVGRPVCLKLPHLEYESDIVFYQRFLREEAIALRLEHPHIVRALRPRMKSRLYLVTEYVPGSSLRALIQNGPLPEARALDIARQLAAAVAHLHAQGIVHRDLKPENVIVTPAGEVKLIDFGIALDRAARRLTWTRLSSTIGTPDYMSPEQIAGGRGDERCDIYAAALILCEMLTGRLPFAGSTAEDPILPAHLGPELSAILCKALARRPRDRQQSMAELLDQLRRPEEVAGLSDLPAPAPSLWFPRLLAALAVGALALFVWLSRPARDVSPSTPLPAHTTGSQLETR